MSIAIRPATEAELALVRGTWRPQMRPRFRDSEPMGAGFRGHTWGPDRYIGHTALANMYREHADRLTTTSAVLVASLKDEALGWIARSLSPDEETGRSRCVVHFVYVLKPARGEGLGAKLLRYVRQEARTASATCVPECMTAAGASLWESEKSQ